jgi:glycosyltransferase involved in cell wall biosynthesis
VISLVVGTLNRTVELDRLLTSLREQTHKDFEVVIVDQNSDDRVLEVLEQYPGLQIKHLRCGRGLSRARNVGLAVATGSICAVPDDDCWYPPDLLHSVNSWLSANPNFDILLTSVRNEHGDLQGPLKRSSVGCVCDKYNIWHNGISYSAFWRRTVVDDVQAFDERIGVGADTKFQSGEELDYFLRALRHGHQIWFEPSISVFHPSAPSIHQRILKQTYPYALGTGYVLRKYGYSPYIVARDFVAYSFAGALLSLCKADIGTTRIRLLRVLGMLVGYVSAGRHLSH